MFRSKCLLEEEKVKDKTTQAAKWLLTSIKEKGPLGRKAPSPEKKRAVSEDQEGCE